MAQNQNEVNGLEVHLRQGGPGVSLRGSLVVLVVIMLAVGGGLGYLMDLNRRSAEGAMRGIAQQHEAFVRSQDRLSCIVSLTPDERVKFRNEWNPGAYARWCGWLADENVKPEKREQ